MEFKNTSSSHSDVSETFLICEKFSHWFDSMMTSRVALITTALTCPFAVFLNGLTLFAFYKNPSLRKPPNVFLIALVIADFIKSAVASPLFIFMHGLYLNMTQPSCSLVVIFINTSLYLPSLFLLASLNIERFISIKAPFWHRAHITKSILVKIAVSDFVLASILTIAPMFTSFPTIIIRFATLVITLVCAFLIWWELKKRSNQANNADTGRHGYKSRAKDSSSRKRLNLSRKVCPKSEEDSPTEKAHQENQYLDSPEIQQDISDSSSSKDDHGLTELQISKKGEGENDVKSCTSRKLSIDKAVPSCQKLGKFPLEVQVVVKKDGVDHPDISENIEDLDETKQAIEKGDSSCQRAEKLPLEVQVLVKKGRVDRPDISENIEDLGETKQCADQKKKDQEEKTNKVKNQPCPTKPSTRSLKARKSERKAAKLATYLVIGLTLTGYIPMFIGFAFHSRGIGYSVFPLIPALGLLSSLVNPVINIGMNHDIRQACWKIITCS